MDKNVISILFVEDDKNLGTVVRDYLTLSGYIVDLVENGDLGWEAYNRKKYDLCVLDVMLPKKDGFTLAGMIRKQDQIVPILFLTAKAAQEDILKGLRTGADDYPGKRGPSSVFISLISIMYFQKACSVFCFGVLL